MKPLRLLDEADRLRLESLLDPESLPRLVGEQRGALTAALAEAGITRDPAELESRIGIADRITLVSPSDSRDWYQLEIVLPQEAEIDADKISVLTPVGLAVLGRRMGDRVSWETPAGERVMTITAVLKHALPA
jgi:regulator of nucleoside diphosphate kinase